MTIFIKPAKMRLRAPVNGKLSRSELTINPGKRNSGAKTPRSKRR
jgi:hypothetical protein